MSRPFANQLTVVVPCPHCGNTTPQTLVSQSRIARRPDGTYTDWYYLLACSTCQNSAFYRHPPPDDIADGAFLPEMSAEDGTLAWPAVGRLDDSVPARVRGIYAEADRIKAFAPNAFANQVRRALEAVCQDRAAAGGTLAKNLNTLASRGEIPPTLADMTNILRHLGNIGSHAGDEEIDPEYVDVIDDFFRAVVEYVYIAPKRVQEVRDRLERYRKAE